MPAADDGRKPSELTNRFWVYADAPGHEKADREAVGKWLLFIPVVQVDQWWDRIKDATEAGCLGVGAKVATARPNPRAVSPETRLICVYTRDWHDRDDVRRVLGALRDLGVPWKLAYKTDAATAAGVYGRGASVYVSQPGSRDFRERAPQQDTLF